MLVKVTSKRWEGSRGEALRIPDTTNGNVILINGSHINGLLVRASTKSKMMYNDNPRDPREKASYIETESTVAAVKAAADATFQSTFVSLLVHTDNDVTAATVATLINCESIAYVLKHATYPAGKSRVVYYEGSKRREVIVAYSLDQILSLADDGNLTTV